MSVNPAPLELLRQLIRFDTTNPPGNELACIQYIDGLLRAAGFETQLLAKDPQRPNLVTRLPGRGEAPPLLLQGHVDVVTTVGQHWEHPPFAAEIADGFLWGRGTLDMKGGVAMMLSALLAAKAEGLTPAGDILLAVVVDEENHGTYGARFLAEEHAEQFADVRYALGEFGGFNLQLAGQTFHLIQVAEKKVARYRASFEGAGGHGSLPVRGGAMANLATFLHNIDRRKLPVRLTPASRGMIEAIAAQLAQPTRLVLKQLLNPRLTDRIVGLLSPQLDALDAILRNTVSPTILHGGEKINVIPNQVAVDLDVRLVPSCSRVEFEQELRQAAGVEMKLTCLTEDPAAPEPDLGLFPLLSDVLQQQTGGGPPIPFVQPAVTDARWFGQLGIQSYGFTPMILPPDFRFTTTIHAANERIPVEAVDFGTQTLLEVIRHYR